MKNILIVTGSARPNSVNERIVSLVSTVLGAEKGVSVSIADLAELGLPFFDAPSSPAADGYEAPSLSVKRWSSLVKGADGVVFVAPEYNHSMTALQKNAIDWLYREWAGKPVAFVGYGWYAGVYSLAQFKDIGSVVKWRLGDKTTGLKFKKDIEFDGSFIDKASTRNAVKETVVELLGVI